MLSSLEGLSANMSYWQPIKRISSDETWQGTQQSVSEITLKACHFQTLTEFLKVHSVESILVFFWHFVYLAGSFILISSTDRELDYRGSLNNFPQSFCQFYADLQHCIVFFVVFLVGFTVCCSECNYLNSLSSHLSDRSWYLSCQLCFNSTV